MSKYRIPVSIETCASHVIGEVECDSIEEFYEKAYSLWESQDWESPTTNISNNFDLGVWEISGDLKECDLEYYAVPETGGKDEV